MRILALSTFTILTLSACSRADVLCHGDYRLYKTVKGMKSAEGVVIPAGTEIRVKACEYADQAQFEFRMPNQEYSSLQPIPEHEEKFMYELRSK